MMALKRTLRSRKSYGWHSCLAMDFDGFSVDMIPGHVSGADYVVDVDEALTLINGKVQPYTKPIKTLNISGIERGLLYE